MKIPFINRFTGSLICDIETGDEIGAELCIKLALEKATKARAYLAGANLAGANLADAYLAGADQIIALGQPNGYWAHAALSDGGIRLHVGCHRGDMTLAEGRAYWAGKDNRREVMAALDYIEAVAKIRGWVS